MTRLLILEGWNSYRRSVLEPAGAGPVQVKECRYAFYAGSMMLFQAIMNILEPGSEPTDKDLAQMQAIDDEIHAYGEQMKELAKRHEGEKKGEE